MYARICVCDVCVGGRGGDDTLYICRTKLQAYMYVD